MFVPEEMKKARRWIWWKLERRQDGTFTKTPCSHDGFRISAADLSLGRTWGYLEGDPSPTATGKGFQLGPPFTGIDLDDCIVDGKIVPEAQAIIDQLGSWAEISPSGKGVHIIVKGGGSGTGHQWTPAHGKFKKIECYFQDRFFTTTGNQVPGTPQTLSIQPDGLLARLGYDEKLEVKKAAVHFDRSLGELTENDKRLLDVARRAKNGEAFKRLYDVGDWQGTYPSQSQADLALCGMLEFYFPDRQDIDRVFAHSGLMREKWERQDYAEATIAKVLNPDGPHYTPFDADAAGVAADLSAEVEIIVQPAPATAASTKVNEVAKNDNSECERMYQASLQAADDRLSILRSAFLSVGEFCAMYKTESEPVICDLLRGGEVGNLISGPKMRKSLLLDWIAMRVSQGLPIWKFGTRKNRVALIDYELQPGTLARRLHNVADACGLDLAKVGKDMQVLTLRGKKSVDVELLCELIEKRITQQEFGLVIIDPLYMSYPDAMDENDNAKMASIFKRLIEVATKKGVAVLLVHHFAKGDNSQKQVTDLGAGAGSQSRATDVHLAIQRHAEEDCAVFSGVIRSFPSFEPFVLRWVYPVYQLEPNLLATDLWRQARRNAKVEAEPLKSVTQPYTLDDFLSSCVSSQPKSRQAVIDACTQVSARQAAALLRRAVDTGRVLEEGTGNSPRRYRVAGVDGTATQTGDKPV